MKTKKLLKGARLVRAVETEIANVVDKGETFLNEREPDWWKRISIPDLDMTRGHACICGQLFMDKVTAWDEVDYIGDGYEYASQKVLPENDREGETMGFVLPPKTGSLADEFDELEAWAWEKLAHEWIYRVQYHQNKSILRHLGVDEV